MQAKLDFVVDDPLERKPSKVIIRYAGVENVIHKEEVMKPITESMLKDWRMLGLTKEQIKIIIQFLKDL